MGRDILPIGTHFYVRQTSNVIPAEEFDECSECSANGPPFHSATILKVNSQMTRRKGWLSIGSNSMRVISNYVLLVYCAESDETTELRRRENREYLMRSRIQVSPNIKFKAFWPVAIVIYN